jgi:hypothetical protein
MDRRVSAPERQWPMAHTRVARRFGLGLSVLALGVAGCSGPDPRHAAGAAAPAPRPAPAVTGAATSPTALAATPDAKCAYAPSKGALPTWARSGFSPPYDSWPYVTSKSGHIVGVLFGDPLHAGTPAATQAQNKILWVAREPAVGPMTIDAELVGSTERVDLGPVPIGPSYVNVPQAGCWHLTLHLASGDDSVDIVYGKG